MLGLGLGFTSPAVLGGTAGPVPWTPVDLGAALAAWWHADDTADGAVASWVDRVGSRNATATAGLEPVSAATSFNGVKRGVTFDGANDELVLAGTTGLPIGATAGEIWAIVNNTAPGAVTTVRPIVRYGAVTVYRSLQRTGVAGVNRASATEGATNLIDTVIDFAGYHILGAAWSGTTQGGRVDGRDTNPASVTIATLATGTTRLRLGSVTAASSTNWWLGSIRHVLITLALTAGQREQLEGWLAHDSALASVLPGGHPYKTTPP